MIIKLIESSFKDKENLLLDLLKDFKKIENLNSLQKDLSILNNFYMVLDVKASANFFLNFSSNKNFNITFDNYIHGLESFNILFNENQPKLSDSELSLIKDSVMSCYDIHSVLSKRETSRYTIANILPGCNLKRAIVSASLQTWIEYFYIIGKHLKDEEFIDFILFASKAKNIFIKLYPVLSENLHFKSELEYNFNSEQNNKEEKIPENLIFSEEFKNKQ